MTTLVARIAASLALTGVVLPVSAFAMPVEAAPSTSVSYRDLDLTTPAGARALDHRVKAAAERVCGYADPQNLAAMRPVVACRKVAMASAAPQVQLALAAARTGQAYAANAVRMSPAY